MPVLFHAPSSRRLDDRWRGIVTTYMSPWPLPGIDNYWSILKRGLIGTFHRVTPQRLSSYLQEFEYRFNRRQITDGGRFADLLSRPQGRLTWFCRTPQPENPTLRRRRLR